MRRPRHRIHPFVPLLALYCALTTHFRVATAYCVSLLLRPLQDRTGSIPLSAVARVLAALGAVATRREESDRVFAVRTLVRLRQGCAGWCGML